VNYIVLISNKILTNNTGFVFLDVKPGCLTDIYRTSNNVFNMKFFLQLQRLYTVGNRCEKKVNCLWNSQIWHNNLFIQQILLTEKNIFELSWTCLGAEHEIVLNGNVRTDIYLSWTKTFYIKY